MTARTDPETPLTRVLFTRHLRTDAGPEGRWDYTITAYSRQVVLTPELLQGVVQQAYDQAGIRATGSGRTAAEVTRAAETTAAAILRAVGERNRARGTAAALEAQVARMQPAWSAGIRHDGSHEYSESSDCDGTHLAYWRRLPALSAKATKWERCDAIPDAADYREEDK